ncbi:MAG: D-glycero-alpha-D-manno-heptose-1,7-bisphosphate 7-phosphatase [Planctomycetales bacterium]
MMLASTAPRRFVLLDRDGTINVERHYLSQPGQLSLLPGAAAGLRAMRELGLGLVVVTNQSGVGRGYFDLGRLTAIHERLHELLGAAGVELDGVYYCPHPPDAGCLCRKPREGMALAASRDLGFRLDQSFMIGDKPCDIELGHRVRATTLLVQTGYGIATAGNPGDSSSGGGAPHHVVASLKEAASVIRKCLRSDRSGGESSRRAA